MSAVEYWVMRVVMKAPADGMIGSLPADVAADVAAGRLVLVNGDICEPIEDHSDQETANARLLKIAARTGIEHKLVLNADL